MDSYTAFRLLIKTSVVLDIGSVKDLKFRRGWYPLLVKKKDTLVNAEDTLLYVNLTNSNNCI